MIRYRSGMLVGIFFFNFFVFFNFFSAQAWAAHHHSHHAKQLSALGVDLFRQGKLSHATEKFAEALIQDPNDEKAQEYLRLLIDDEDRVVNKRRQEVLRFLELLDYTQFLKSRVDEFVHENTALIEFLNEKAMEDQELFPSLETFQSRMKTIQESMDDSFEEPFAQFQKDKPIEFTVYVQFAAFAKQDLVGRLEILRADNQQLIKLKGRAAVEIGSHNRPPASQKFSDFVKTIRMQVREKNRLLKGQEESLRALTQELGAVRKDFEEMQDKFSSTDEKIATLTKDLAVMSLEIFDKNKTILDKDSRLEELEKELMDSQERLNLVQKIIEEKDSRILVLEQNIQKVDDEAEQTDAVDEALESFSRESAGEIRTLSDQLVILRKEYDTILADIRMKEVQIAQLQGVLNFKNQKIINFQKILTSKDQKLSEVSGFLEIYKSKLDEAVDDLDKKNRMLDFLEQQLDEVSGYSDQEQLSAIEENSELDTFRFTDDNMMTTLIQQTAPANLRARPIDSAIRNKILNETRIKLNTVQSIIFKNGLK